METESYQLAIQASSLLWALVILLTIGCGIVAFNKRAALVGVGMTVGGVFSGLGLVFRYVGPMFLDETMFHLEIWPLMTLFLVVVELVCTLTVLAGLVKLPQG